MHDIVTNPKDLMDSDTRLQQVLSKLQQKKTVRFNVLSGFLNKLQGLYKELGLSTPDEFKELGEELSSTKMKTFEEEYNRLDHLKKERTDQVAFLVASFSNLVKELCIPKEELTNELDHLILRSEHIKIGVHPDAIARLRARVEELDAEKLRRQIEIDGFSKQILTYWDLLQIPQEERKSFSKLVSDEPLSRRSIEKVGNILIIIMMNNDNK